MTGRCNQLVEDEVGAVEGFGILGRRSFGAGTVSGLQALALFRLDTAGGLR